MKKSSKRSVLSWLLLLALVLSLAGCGGGAQRNPDAESPSSGDLEPQPPQTLFLNPLEIPLKAAVPSVLDTGLQEMAIGRNTLNSDTIGWLKIPDTTIDDVVMFYPGDRNQFYLRRDFNKLDNWYGSYFADYRSMFEGGWSGLSRNTVIYGHSMEDNPNGKAFSQLKKFLTEDFAREHPYIYFSTTDEDMAFEVFAVFYATIDLPYNRPNPSDEDFLNIVEEVRARSLYNYDTQVKADDKILTLSTCCYNFTTAYPNNYRYVIMAKLVKPGNKLTDEASFTKNPSPKAP